MKKHATALRAFTHADDSIADRQVILNMDPGQFDDWRDAGLVREATDVEVGRAQGAKAPAAARPPVKRSRKAKVVAKSLAVDPAPPLTPAEPIAAAEPAASA